MQGVLIALLFILLIGSASLFRMYTKNIKHNMGVACGLLVLCMVSLAGIGAVLSIQS